MNGRRTTLKDVAKRAGVHVSTVSRALDPRSKHLISPDVIEKISRAAQQIGYRHNQMAASLRTRKTQSIGIVIPDITNMLFPPIIRGIEDHAARQGYLAMIGNTDGDADRERQVIEALQTRGVDGLIVASADLDDKSITSAIKEGMPVVTVNRRVKDKGVSSVISDEKGGIGAMVEHLVSLGHKRIGYLSGPLSSSTGEARLNAYRYWTKHYGVEYGDDLIARAEDYREADGAACAEDLLSRNPDLTAIVCAADVLAIGALSAVKKLDLNCPRDISVTGFNDIPFVDRLSPSLTTVHVEHYQCGSAAVEILLEHLEAEPAQRKPRHIVLPVSLVARESSGPAKQSLQTRAAAKSDLSRAKTMKSRR